MTNNHREKTIFKKTAQQQAKVNYVSEKLVKCFTASTRTLFILNNFTCVMLLCDVCFMVLVTRQLHSRDIIIMKARIGASLNNYLS